MEEYGNEINTILDCIEEYNNGDENYLEYMEYIASVVKKYTNSARFKYIEFLLLEKYLDIHLRLVNNVIRESEDFQQLFGYCQDDLRYYLASAKELRIFIKKAIKNKDYECLDSAYLLTIYLSYILTNISNYFGTLSRVVGAQSGHFYYSLPDNIRQTGQNDIKLVEDELKKLRRE